MPKHTNSIIQVVRSNFWFIGDKGNEKHGKHHNETITQILIMGHFMRQLVHSLRKVNVMVGNSACGEYTRLLETKYMSFRYNLVGEQRIK